MIMSKNVTSYARFMGLIAMLLGVFFIAVGVLGIFFAVKDLVSSPLGVKPATVVSSVESPLSGHYSIRARVDDGREVMISGEQGSRIGSGVKLRLVLKDGAYSIYDPNESLIGSLIALASGIGLYLAGRRFRSPRNRM